VRILFLSRWYPFPPDNGAKIRVHNLLRQLAQAHEVSLLSFTAPTDRVDLGTAGAEQICADVRTLPFREFQPTSRRALAGFLSSQPRYLVDTYSEAFAAAVDAHLATRDVDLVMASQLAMMPYALRARGWPLIMEELELSLFRAQPGQADGVVSSARRQLTWLKIAAYLRRTLKAFAACTVVSEGERRNVFDAAPAYRNVHVIPNAVAVQEYAGDFGAREPGSLVFAGALSYAVNYEGLAWMLGSVQPILAAELPSATLRVTGRTEGLDLGRLPAAPGCQFTGYVPDIRPVIARAMVSVVPLLAGGGTRLKILESMALGTPVVSTSKGAEGLDVVHGENILIADSPADFARCTGAVLRDPALWKRLSEGGLALVRARYDWEAVGHELRSVVEQAAAQPGRSLAGAAS
jgi:polysaccharide biosynthesis protein PslH